MNIATASGIRGLPKSGREDGRRTDEWPGQVKSFSQRRGRISGPQGQAGKNGQGWMKKRRSATSWGRRDGRLMRRMAKSGDGDDDASERWMERRERCGWAKTRILVGHGQSKQSRPGGTGGWKERRLKNRGAARRGRKRARWAIADGRQRRSLPSMSSLSSLSRENRRWDGPAAGGSQRGWWSGCERRGCRLLCLVLPLGCTRTGLRVGRDGNPAVAMAVVGLDSDGRRQSPGKKKSLEKWEDLAATACSIRYGSLALSQPDVTLHSTREKGPWPWPRVETREDRMPDRAGPNLYWMRAKSGNVLFVSRLRSPHSLGRLGKEASSRVPPQQAGTVLMRPIHSSNFWAVRKTGARTARSYPGAYSRTINGQPLCS